ncbi:MAG: hypothetical protein AB7S80_18520, partial [Rhizobiaceae bacterium]
GRDPSWERPPPRFRDRICYPRADTVSEVRLLLITARTHFGAEGDSEFLIVSRNLLVVFVDDTVGNDASAHRALPTGGRYVIGMRQRPSADLQQW